MNDQISIQQKRGWDTCPAPSVPAGEIEKFVVEQIKTIGGDEDLVRATVSEMHKQVAAGQAGRSTTLAVRVPEFASPSFARTPLVASMVSVMSSAPLALRSASR